MKKILLLLASVLFLFPAAASLILSFVPAETAAGLFENAFFSLASLRPSVSQYFKLLIEDFWFYPTFWNSLLYAAVSAVGACIVAIPASFALVNGNRRLRNTVLTFCAVLILLPLQVTILPQYIGLRDMGLLNTRGAIILPALFSPFAIFIITQYMLGIDKQQLEAARLETNSVTILVIRVVLPQIRICIFTVLIFLFSESWNMVEQPTVLLRDKRLLPASAMIGNLSKADTATVFAVAVMVMIPPVLIYGFLEEELSDGLREIAVKL